MTAPIVSVLIDTYNHERFIARAIQSVLEQDFPADATEIIVVDDGSTDRTPGIVRQFAPRVRLIRKPNGGQASAFNVGISETHGEFVALLDGDDWWAKTKLRMAVDTLTNSPEVAAVGHGYTEVSEGDQPAERFLPAERYRLNLSSKESAKIAAQGRHLLGSWITVRRTALNQIVPIPARFAYCADVPIYTLALALGGAIIINQSLGCYRRHSANLFLGDMDSMEKLCRKRDILDFELQILPPRLAELGVAPEVIAAFFESDRIEFEMLRLQTVGGSRWKTLQVEMRAFKASYRKASPGYFLFRCLAALIILMFPPRRFYRIKNWYAKKGLARFRKWFATAEPTVPSTLFQRQPVKDSPNEIAARS